MIYIGDAQDVIISNDQLVAGAVFLYPIASTSTYAFSSTTAITPSVTTNTQYTYTALAAGYYAISIIVGPNTATTPAYSFQSDFYNCPTQIGANTDHDSNFQGCLSSQYTIENYFLSTDSPVHSNTNPRHLLSNIGCRQVI